MRETVVVPGGVIERWGDGWCARLERSSANTLVGFYRTRLEAELALQARYGLAAAAPALPVPFTILTGFLGAGKTTILNRVLRTAGRRLAVLVNDVGRVNIDRALIVDRGADVIELSGGCVCCAVDVQQGLWQGAVELADRTHPDHIVLETTGIAEPDVIIAQLADRPLVRQRLFAAGVVCVVDAEDGGRWLDERPEARSQLATADRVVLSKLDRASALAVARIHARLRELAPELAVVSFPRTEEGDRQLAAWLLEPRPIERRALDDHAHRHGQLTVITFVEDSPLLARPLMHALKRLGPALLRAKGFIHVAGEARRGYLERAGQRLELRLDEQWGDRPRRTELVLIGVGLDEAVLRRCLWSAIVADNQELAPPET